MPAVATITSLPYAGRGMGDRNSPVTLHAEITRIPVEVQAGTEDAIPDGFLADSYATTAAQVVAPSVAFATATPIAIAIVHHPTSLTIPIAGKPHTITPRIVSTSYSTTAMQPLPSQKVPCSPRECLTVNEPSSPDSIFPPTM